MDAGITAQIEDASGNFILDAPNAPVFKTIIGAIGWADPHHEDTSHALLIGGETADNRFIFMHEFMGSFPNLIKEAIDIKDRLLLSAIWLDTRERDLHIQLATADGLTRYESLGLDHFGRDIWATESNKWSFFRDRETTTQLFSVPEILFTSGLKGMDRVVSMVASKELSLHSSCVLCAWVMEQHSASLTHPLSKAMCYLGYALKIGHKSPDKNEPLNKRVYPNLKEE